MQVVTVKVKSYLDQGVERVELVVCDFDNMCGKEEDGVYMKSKTWVMWEVHVGWKESIGSANLFLLFHP